MLLIFERNFENLRNVINAALLRLPENIGRYFKTFKSDEVR
jgi:hypothetical protein